MRKRDLKEGEVYVIEYKDKDFHPSFEDSSFNGLAVFSHFTSNKIPIFNALDNGVLIQYYFESRYIKRIATQKEKINFKKHVLKSYSKELDKLFKIKL